MALITLAQSEKIIDAVLVRARELQCRPVSVVIMEPGAVIKAFKKEDGSSMMRFEMATGKAYAALALGRSSSLVRVRAEQRPLFMDFLFKASEDRIFAEGGGMLIRAADGELLGAVGVTGDTQERDEELAAHGIRAAGLKTDEDCENLAHHVRLKN
ncbi:MAG: GlcG/HbpS family heme-binding protein [Burkholderiales bacterium]